jgi:hypothetical protein
LVVGLTVAKPFAKKIDESVELKVTPALNTLVLAVPVVVLPGHALLAVPQPVRLMATPASGLLITLRSRLEAFAAEAPQTKTVLSANNNARAVPPGPLTNFMATLRHNKGVNRANKEPIES